MCIEALERYRSENPGHLPTHKKNDKSFYITDILSSVFQNDESKDFNTLSQLAITIIAAASSY